MRPFISRYPKFFSASPEFRDLQHALEPELLDLWAARDSAASQLCVETATWGLSYWEKTLGIPVDEEKDLDVRRARVRSKLMGADVTTVALVEKVAEIYVGFPAKVQEFPKEFWVQLSICLNEGSPKDLEGLRETLLEIMPAHLGWGFRFWLDLQAHACAGGGLAGSREEVRVTVAMPRPLTKPGGLAAAHTCAGCTGTVQRIAVAVAAPKLTRPAGLAHTAVGAGLAHTYQRMGVRVRNPFTSI